MPAAIDISAIYKSFGSVHALDGVDLRIGRGEFFGLLGPNGAGKSTLINLIAGLIRADRGQLSVMGYDVVRHYQQARRCIGVVPQELVFDPFFTVREVLRIQGGYFGLGRENDDWVDELLHELMLTDKADTNMRALSGGMKRRVLIAQALVHRPDVVVLDEPTAGVDVEIRKLLWEFIQRLHRSGQTIVLTTHYLEEAESMCERIAILNHGRVVALDSKQELLNSALNRTQRIRISCCAPVTQLPATLSAKEISREDNTVELVLQRDSDSIIEILEMLRAAGNEIVDLHTERADLEDVFMELTRGASR